jgi:hypothetical protein
MGIVLGIGKYEEPAFAVVDKDGAFELRQYKPRVIAEVCVDGNMDEASSKGFRLIANYIFGNNIKAGSSSQDGESEKVPMTAPVSLTPSSKASESASIPMTAPVTVQPANGQWLMNFFMPSNYTLATLPRPSNPAVVLKEVAPQKMVALGFSGLAYDATVAARASELEAWAGARGLETTGPVQFARFNPPWTLPFLRRNEVLFEVKGAAVDATLEDK